MIRISDTLYIPEEELVFTASRSGGPGGQNVNKVSTRVTLSFDVARSPHLSEAQKGLLRTRLKTRISKDGILQIVSQQTRSQAENRALALARFADLLHAALKPLPVRKKTKIPRAAKRRRLESKRRQSLRKKERSKPFSEE